MAERVGLAQVIGQLRQELSAAMRDGEAEDLRFELGPVELELTVAVSKEAGPNAKLTIVPQGQPPVTVARFGGISDRAAVLAVQAVGFPRFKLKTDDGGRAVYRDSHQAVGSVAVLSNRREGTLEVTVLPPERDPDPVTSPWEGMSGAAVWVGDRIVGVIAKHHRCDGLGRLAAARLELALEGWTRAGALSCKR
ncbi:MAG: trypco2 family protein [Pseudonocardiales bacterium]